ncbi:MAG: hypothetical protein GXY38_04740 [Planctomycetes bacterium]|jgi:hypothetical protein|nr:hypothetical protein [Planctomycetota bacterium]
MCKSRLGNVVVLPLSVREHLDAAMKQMELLLSERRKTLGAQRLIDLLLHLQVIRRDMN